MADGAVTVYPTELLPDGFAYPAEYLEFASAPRTPLYPWWLIDAESEAGRLMHRITVGSSKALVPFAKTDLYDDIACFDAETNTQNPKVVMICSTPGRSYGFRDFATWRSHAERDASEFRAGTS
ncbi:hypothetical protein [Dyella subtropica]|uniref:hypothetical protein n=1 Tax=Dyella subtropica TaxID=2992127 RepID=UPI0022598340|nr:hypothetical protein [Dyella subtropica]